MLVKWKGYGGLWLAPLVFETDWPDVYSQFLYITFYYWLWVENFKIYYLKGVKELTTWRTINEHFSLVKTKIFFTDELTFNISGSVNKRNFLIFGLQRRICIWGKKDIVLIVTRRVVSLISKYLVTLFSQRNTMTGDSFNLIKH